MKLRYSTTSPYVRKVMIAAMECGIDLDLVPTNAWAADTQALTQDNPLGKIPVLLLDNGENIYDSAVICEYLDARHSGHRLFPSETPERWRQLRTQALAQGILDAAVQIRVETAVRPADKQWDGWISRQQAAIIRALDALEKDVGHWGGVFLIGPITVACALGYLDFRKTCDWRQGRPHLAHWYQICQNRRSVRETEPKDPA